MKFEHIVYERSGHIASIMLNRPKVLNALIPAMCRELSTALRDLHEDESLRVGVLSGAGGRAFCVGADLKYRAAEGPPLSGRPPSDEVRELLECCPKPIIAAVSGYAVGGGLELAMRCDIIIATEDSRFGLPEVRRGLIADGGGLFHLPRRIPFHQAMGLILTGELISAGEAHRMGLITDVVPAGGLADGVRRWTAKILECSPLALQAAKEVVRTFAPTPDEPTAGAMDRLTAVRRLRQSRDYLEGPRAFAEKRKPVWEGR